MGAVTPSLRVIDVTGKYKGQDTCYVCEYGTAPTVIGFFPKPSDQAADMIVKLNALVQANKNLKGFVVMINGAESKDWLTKLAADKGITIPMVYFAKGHVGYRHAPLQTESGGGEHDSCGHRPSGVREFREHHGRHVPECCRGFDEDARVRTGAEFGERSMKSSVAIKLASVALGTSLYLFRGCAPRRY